MSATPIDPRSHVAHHERLLARFGTFMAHWDGAHALLHQLTVSIKSLTVVLTRPGQDGNLVISCLGSVRIEASVAWASAHLTLTHAGDSFFLEDAGAHVRIECEMTAFRTCVAACSSGAWPTHPSE